jgi:hypothetical protein
MMNILESLARSALSGDALATRSLLQEWLSTSPVIADVSMPASNDATILSLSAALAELLAERLNQSPPAWSAGVGPAQSPTHLLRSASQMRRLREMCEAESPLPLRRRRFFAPANYLEAH